MLTSVRRVAVRSQQQCRRQPLFLQFSTAPSDVKLGFIGLGNMGGPMAQNLIASPSFQKGSVTVYDVHAETTAAFIDSLKAQGIDSRRVIPAQSIKEVAENSDVVITMLPATQHVNGVLRGSSDSSADSVFCNAKGGTLIIDCSTIDPEMSQELANDAKSQSGSDKKGGFRMLDAPVSGGVTGAAAGTLTFMIGGEAQDIEYARGIFEAMGRNLVHCGGNGTGGIAKLCNNMALAISMIGTSEALALGKRMGIDTKALLGVMNTSTSRCWSSESYCPEPGHLENVPSSRGYTGGFSSALIEKDLTLAMSAAQRVKARVPLGASAHQMYGILCEHGYASKDFSVVFEYLTKSSHNSK